MKNTTFSQLRNQAKKYFDAVERGETIAVYRRGKPIATIVPHVTAAARDWRKAFAVSRKGVSLSRAILRERQRNAR